MSSDQTVSSEHRFYFGFFRLLINLIASLILTLVFCWYIFNSGRFFYLATWLQIAFVIAFLSTCLGVIDFGTKLLLNKPGLIIDTTQIVLCKILGPGRVIPFSELKSVTPFKMQPLANFFQRDQLILEFQNGHTEKLDIENLRHKQNIYPLLDQHLHPNPDR